MIMPRDLRLEQSSGRADRRRSKHSSPLSSSLCLPPSDSTNCEVRCAAPLPLQRQPGKERAGGGSSTSRGLGPRSRGRARIGGSADPVPDSPCGTAGAARLPLRGPACGRTGGSGCGAGRAPRPRPSPARALAPPPHVALAAARLARPVGGAGNGRAPQSRPAHSHGWRGEETLPGPGLRCLQIASPSEPRTWRSREDEEEGSGGAGRERTRLGTSVGLVAQRGGAERRLEAGAARAQVAAADPESWPEPSWRPQLRGHGGSSARALPGPSLEVGSGSGRPVGARVRIRES